jgi:transposase
LTTPPARPRRHLTRARPALRASPSLRPPPWCSRRNRNRSRPRVGARPSTRSSHRILVRPVSNLLAFSGRKPTLRARLRRKHFSIIGALTLDGRLYVGMQPRAYKAADVVVFLKHLLAWIPRKLIVIRDGTNIHRGAEMDAFLASTEGKRIEVEVLPGYAPELNPAEGIWGYLKQDELRNVCCESLNDLRTTVRRAIRRLQKKRRVLSTIVRMSIRFRKRCKAA